MRSPLLSLQADYRKLRGKACNNQAMEMPPALWAGIGAVVSAAAAGWLMAREQVRSHDHSHESPAGGWLVGGFNAAPGDGAATGCCLALGLVEMVNHGWLALAGLLVAIPLGCVAWRPERFLAEVEQNLTAVWPYVILLTEPDVWVPVAALAAGFTVSCMTDSQASR